MPKLHPFKFKSSFGTLAKNLERLSMQNINTIGNHINNSIQKGIEQGKDIDGKSFKPLKPSSRDARKARTLYYGKQSGSGFKPLMWSENLRKTSKKPATLTKHKFIIEMNAARGYQYGAMHNQKGGYITSPKSAVPNKKVPQRKWFGIPKDMRTNGKELELAVNNLGRNIGHFFGGTHTKKIKI